MVNVCPLPIFIRVNGAGTRGNVHQLRTGNIDLKGASLPGALIVYPGVSVESESVSIVFAEAGDGLSDVRRPVPARRRILYGQVCKIVAVSTDDE